jgi:hypothetical protein
MTRLSSRTVTRLLLGILLLTLLAEPWLHHHTPLSVAPFALVLLISGFGCLIFLAVACIISPLISRREDYYDQ